MSFLGRQERTHSVPLRWWLVGSSLLAVGPVLALAFALLQGGSGKRSEFALPGPSLADGASQSSPAAVVETDPGEEATDALPSLPWDTPERLDEAVAFLLARGDRKSAMGLLGRMAPGSEVYEKALTQLNRRFVDGWHAVVAAAVRECLAADQTLEPAARQDLVGFLATCTAGRNQIAVLPLGVGGTRATILAVHAWHGFAGTIDDCPADYLRTLVSRMLGSFPGVVPLLGEAPVLLSWTDPRASVVSHLRARVLLPWLGERVGLLWDAGRRSPAVEKWLARVVADGKRWRLYLVSPDGEADRHAALALLPAVLRRSWQRDASLALLAKPGVREFLVAEDLLGAIWPGESSAAEVEELARLAIASQSWRDALRALDYAAAETAADDAVALLLGNGRADVAGHLRSLLGTERTQLAAGAFPWYRIMRSLKVRDTPVFWQGHALLTAGELAHLQSGDKRIEEISPATVRECMLWHVGRIPDAAARQAALAGVRAYALNRDLSPKQAEN